MFGKQTCAVCLCFLIGLVSGQILTPELAARPASPVNDRASLAAAGAYYEAVNRYLERGEMDQLLLALDSGFVDHPAIAGELTTDGLIRYFAALRATYPDLRMRAESMSPQGDLVAVSLATTSGTAVLTGDFLVDRPPSLPRQELLRIANGRVAERWGAINAPPQAELAGGLEIPVLAGWSVHTSMEQIELAPGDTRTLLGRSFSFLIASTQPLSMSLRLNESKKPALLSSRAMQAPIELERGITYAMTPGQIVQGSGSERYLVNNPGDQPASAIFVNVSYQSPVLVDGRGPKLVVSDDIEYQAPDGLMFLKSVPSRAYRLTLFEVAAPPSEAFALYRSQGIEQLLVTGGTIEVASREGFVDVFEQGGRKMLAPGETKAIATGGLSAFDEALFSYRVAGNAPATFWLLSLAPLSTG